MPDLRCPGLAIRIAPSGIKTWDVLFRIRGTAVVKRKALGAFPAVTLAQARDRMGGLGRAAQAGVKSHDAKLDVGGNPYGKAEGEIEIYGAEEQIDVNPKFESDRELKVESHGRPEHRVAHVLKVDQCKDTRPNGNIRDG